VEPTPQLVEAEVEVDEDGFGDFDDTS